MRLDDAILYAILMAAVLCAIRWMQFCVTRKQNKRDNSKGKKSMIAFNRHRTATATGTCVVGCVNVPLNMISVPSTLSHK